VNTISSDNKTEREVERKRAGLSFLIVNLGVPWVLRPNSPVLSQSCPKRVLFFFFRRKLPHSVMTLRLNYAVFELLLTIPCILVWLLCYICNFPKV